MNRDIRFQTKTAWMPACALCINWSVLQLCPWLELGVFARAAAWLAGACAGSPVATCADGWKFWFHGLPMLVTTTCSATDYFLLLTALLGWQLARAGVSTLRGLTAACLLAVPVTITVNALRLITLAVAHRWLIPLAPDTYEHFLHLLFGLAVFLPALVAINALLELRHDRITTHTVS